MSNIYFLKCLGFSNIYQENDEQLKVKISGHEKKYGHFVYDMASWIGLKMDSGGNDNSNDSRSCENVMSLVLQCVESLIKLKMAISIDLVILSCIYANYCKNYQFFNVLSSTIIECLNGNDENYKTRNYQWFKHFILNSNLGW